MSEIINLDNIKKKENTVKNICDHASDIYSNVLILGLTKDGCCQMMSSFKDQEKILWHMEFAKYHFIKNGLTEE